MKGGGTARFHPLFWWHGAIATKFMVIRGHYMDIRVKCNVSSI